MSGNNPQRSSSMKPLEGMGASSILFSSSAMRSFEMIWIRFFVTRQRLKRFVINIKIELGGKTDTPHHAKWVIAEGDVRVKWCTDCTLFQIIHPAEWVYQFAETFFC